MDSSNIPEVPVSQEAPVKQEPERKGSYRATFTFHAEKPANSWSDSSIPANNVARRKFKLEVSSLQAKSREELALTQNLQNIQWPPIQSASKNNFSSIFKPMVPQPAFPSSQEEPILWPSFNAPAYQRPAKCTRDEYLKAQANSKSPKKSVLQLLTKKP